MVNKLNPEDNPGFTPEEQDEQLKLAADAVAQSLLDILDTELPGHPGATLNIMYATGGILTTALRAWLDRKSCCVAHMPIAATSTNTGNSVPK